MKQPTAPEIFRERITEFLEHQKDMNHKYKPKDFAEQTAISYKTINSYICPTAQLKLPRGQELIILAKCMGTTTDYLLGLTNSKSPSDSDLRMISDYTGLSDSAIEVLHNYSQYRNKLTVIDTINFLLEELASHDSLQHMFLESQRFYEEHPDADSDCLFDESEFDFDKYPPPDISDELEEYYSEEMERLHNDVDYHIVSCSDFSGQSIFNLIDTFLHLAVPVKNDYCVTSDGRICSEQQLNSELDVIESSFDKIVAKMSGPKLTEQYFLNLITDSLKQIKSKFFKGSIQT